METHLKLSTLCKIALAIQARRGIRIKCTVQEMWDRLTICAGNCRTVAEATAAIEEDFS